MSNSDPPRKCGKVSQTTSPSDKGISTHPDWPGATCKKKQTFLRQIQCQSGISCLQGAHLHLDLQQIPCTWFAGHGLRHGIRATCTLWARYTQMKNVMCFQKAHNGSHLFAKKKTDVVCLSRVSTSTLSKLILPAGTCQSRNSHKLLCHGLLLSTTSTLPVRSCAIYFHSGVFIYM